MARIEPGKNADGLVEPYLVGVGPPVEPGRRMAEARLGTLRGCLGAEVRALDFSDDRLARGLELLSDDEQWKRFEAVLNQRCLRVYKLKPEQVRIDTTSASGYWAGDGGWLVSTGALEGPPAGPAAVEVVLATLDPMGMPVACQVVGGNLADDRCISRRSTKCGRG